MVAINLHMFRDEFVVNKRVFHERSAHSKVVLDDSLITVDTTSLDQRARKEVTRVTYLVFQVLRYPRLFLFRFLRNETVLFSVQG